MHGLCMGGGVKGGVSRAGNAFTVAGHVCLCGGGVEGGGSRAGNALAAAAGLCVWGEGGGESGGHCIDSTQVSTARSGHMA